MMGGCGWFASTSKAACGENKKVKHRFHEQRNAQQMEVTGFFFTIFIATCRRRRKQTITQRAVGTCWRTSHATVTASSNARMNSCAHAWFMRSLGTNPEAVHPIRFHGNRRAGCNRTLPLSPTGPCARFLSLQRRSVGAFPSSPASQSVGVGTTTKKKKQNRKLASTRPIDRATSWTALPDGREMPVCCCARA